MARKVVERSDHGMACVDTYHDLWAVERFAACILVEEMKPVTVCRTIGRFNSLHEAEAAAKAALLNHHQ
jgi:hypothetical protein